MAEYIEREALLHRINVDDMMNVKGTLISIRDVKKLIQDFPTADVEPVARCKDCQHYKHYGRTSLVVDGKNVKAGWCERRARYDEEYRMLPDDYCCYGKTNRN